MSRVGARRESEGVVPRATGVPRLAKPARHARYAREVDPFPVTAPQFRPAFTPSRQQARRAGAGCRRLVALGVAPHRPPIATDASGCRAYLVCRARFAGRDTPLAAAADVVRHGHELGMHGWTHEVWQELDPATEEALAERATAALAEAAGVRPLGFRAPGGSRTPHTETVLGRLGYRYDASLGDGMCPQVLGSGLAQI